MTRITPALLILFAWPLALAAQQNNSGTTSDPSDTTRVNAAQLNPTQILGRRIFQQRCAICHLESTPGAKKYGPDLYKELVNGNEDTIRALIANGTKGKMPGFKYGLEPEEISAIVEYLKTVPRPARRATSNQSGGMAGGME